MATAAAIALGVTSAVGLYGASAEEKRVLGPYDRGNQAQLDAERAKAQAAEARAAKLERDLQEERKRRERTESRSCNSPAAEDAFRRANPQILEKAAYGIIAELSIADPKLQDVLKAPAKSIFRRGTILELYELAVLAESSVQRGGATPDPSATSTPELTGVDGEGVVPDIAPATPEVAPPPAPFSPEPAPAPAPSTPEPAPVPAPSTPEVIPASNEMPIAEPLALPVAGEPPSVGGPLPSQPTSIAEMGCLAFAALWLKYINLVSEGVGKAKEEKKAQEAQVRSDTEAVRLSEAFHETLLKAVRSAEESRKSIDEMFDKLPEERKALVQPARDALDSEFVKANELVFATEPGKVPNIATWVSDVESKYPDWKTAKESLQRRLADYETATKGATTTKEKLPLSVRFFGSKVPPRPPTGPLFTGTSVSPGPTSQVVPEPAVAPAPEPVVVAPPPTPLVGPAPEITGPPAPASRPPPGPPTASQTRRNAWRRLASLTPEQRANVLRGAQERAKTRKATIGAELDRMKAQGQPETAAAPIPTAVAPPPAPSSWDVTEAFRKAAEDAKQKAEQQKTKVAKLDAELAKELGPLTTERSLVPEMSEAEFQQEMAALPDTLPVTAAAPAPARATPPLAPGIPGQDSLRKTGRKLWGGLRKRTLKKRRGVNKRNVRGSRRS